MKSLLSSKIVNIKNLNLGDIEEIIKEIEGPAKKIKITCLDPEGLCGALNFLIPAYQQVKNDGLKKKSSEKKRIKGDKEFYKSYFKRTIDNILSTYLTVKNDKKKLIDKGFSDNEINTAILVILTELRIQKTQAKQALALIDNALKHCETKIYTTESLFLYTILPNVYNKYFDRSFGTSQSSLTNENSGPGIRFIQAVTKHMGIEKKAGTIARSCKPDRKKTLTQ